MSYEFNNILDALTARGYALALDSETYGYDSDPSWFVDGGNALSFDSMSTFDGNDYEYMQNILY